MRMSFPKVGIFLVITVAFLTLTASAFAQAQLPYNEGGTDTSQEAGDPLQFPPQAPPPPPPPGCFDSNIQMSATASVSSGGSGVTFGPQIANNGFFGPPPCQEPNGGWAWVGAPACGGGPSGEWIMLEWDAPIDLCQLFVDTKTVANDDCGFTSNPNRIASDAVVQYWNGANWVTAGSVTGQTDDWTFTFGEPVSTTRVRLMDLCVDPAQGFQDDNPIIYELKVYDGLIPVELESFEIDR